MLPGLTGLRFLLAALVVLFHYTKGRPMAGPEAWLNIVALGDAAVTGFFVLSGFVLAKTYLLPDGSMKGTWRAFWSARFARIYPIYVLSIILIFQAYMTTAPRTVGEVLWATGTAVTLTQAWWPETALAINSAAWSLSVEAFLYLVFPVLAPAVRGRAGLVLGVAAVASFVMTPWDAYNPLCHLPAFAAGVAGYLLRRDWAWLGVVSGVVIVGVLGWAGSGERLLLLPFVGLVMGLGARAGAMGSAPMVRLGEASYSLYLLHLPLWPWGMALNAATVRWPMDSWGFVALCFGVSLAGSLVAYRYVEEPYRKALRGVPRLARTGANGATETT
jgi:peptidoglycan/LPS O-acetylase OafA/YrhL